MSNYRDRLETEVNRLGVTAISTRLGVARNTVYNWLAKGNVPLNSLVALEGMGADIRFIIFGPGEGGAQQLAADEQLLVDSYRAMDAQDRKTILGRMLTGQALESGSGISVRGTGNRIAGRDYQGKE